LGLSDGQGKGWASLGLGGSYPLEEAWQGGEEVLGVVTGSSPQRPCRAFAELCGLGAVHRCVPLSVACTGLVNEDLVLQVLGVT